MIHQLRDNINGVVYYFKSQHIFTDMHAFLNSLKFFSIMLNDQYPPDLN